MDVTQENDLNIEFHSELVNRRYNKNTKYNSFKNTIAFAFTGYQETFLEEMKEYSTEIMVEYLQNSHNYYLNKKLPEMANLIQELSKNSDHKLAYILQVFFHKVSYELHKHIAYEEETLFPYINSLIKGETKTTSTPSISASQFLKQHNHEAEDQLKNLNEHLSSTFGKLEHLFEFRHFKTHMTNFETDLRIHGTIEDQILIPRILELEKKSLHAR